MEVYNKNRDNNRSMHDEIREQNAKLKNAPFKEKVEYFKEYYLKTTVIIAATVILAVCIAYSMLTAPGDTAFAAFFFNDTGNSLNDELIDSFVEYMGIDTKEHNAYIDASVYYSPDSAANDYVILEKVMAVMSTQELDIIVGDADVIDYYAKGECFHDVTSVLPDDLMKQFNDKIYYAKTGESGELVPAGIYVTDSPILSKYHYYDGKQPIMGFITNSNSLDNAVAFLRYIYTED